jgi:carnitine O-acetyltransferase
MLTSTGAIGYVGHKTLTPILKLLGTGLNLKHGPYAVVTILRMFDPEPIARTFNQSGYEFVRVEGVRLRQREFDGGRESDETLELIQARGVDPRGWESRGYLYADLFAAAPEKDLDAVVNCLQHVNHELRTGAPEIACK